MRLSRLYKCFKSHIRRYVKSFVRARWIRMMRPTQQRVVPICPGHGLMIPLYFCEVDHMSADCSRRLFRVCPRRPLHAHYGGYVSLVVLTHLHYSGYFKNRRPSDETNCSAIQSWAEFERFIAANTRSQTPDRAIRV